MRTETQQGVVPLKPGESTATVNCQLHIPFSLANTPLEAQMPDFNMQMTIDRTLVLK
jgi:hypothetical protein